MRIGWFVILFAVAASARAAEIAGKIAVGNPKDMWIEVGYVGADALGTKLSNMAGLVAGNGPAQVTCTTWKPRNTTVSWSPGAGCTYRHVGVPPGHYVLYAKLTERGGQKRVILTDWQSVRIASSSARKTVGLSLAAARCGGLDISAPGRTGLLGVRLVPSDPHGRELVPGANSFGLATECDLGPQGARIQGLRAGAYRLTLRQIHRTTSGGGWSATINDLSAWTVQVRACKVANYRLPAR